MDNDGDLDIISSSIFDGKIAWFENLGNGVFSPEIEISIGSMVTRVVHASDLDGDGDLDILHLMQSAEQELGWFENDGFGDFSVHHIITSTINQTVAVYSADFDNDGDKDVVATSVQDDRITWFENIGNGTFGEQITLTTNVNNSYCVYCTDLDDDGFIDILASSHNPNKIIWFKNDGVGGFGPPQIITTDVDDAYSIHTADFDGDGDLDVLTCSWDDDKIAWFENDGNEVFVSEYILNSNVDSPNDAFAVDLENDGDMDVLTASVYDDKIAWYENDGNGNFGGQQIIFSNADGAHSVFSADLDGDGDMDVLSASGNDDKIAWYENDGIGNFGDQQIISSDAILAYDLNTTDLDLDGDIDVLSASYGDDKIAWYENLMGNGCTDPTACNFDSFYNFDDGSCCYGICGCMDPISNNYNPSAECENGSCEYRLDGIIFFDENENGTMDGAEYGLPLQEVILEPVGLIGISNDEGNFLFNPLSNGSYNLTLSPSESFPFSTTPNPLLFNIGLGGTNQELIFGVSNEVPDFAICVDFYPVGFGYPCNDLVYQSVCYRNMGNVPIDGVVEVEFDTLFQGYQEVTPIDSVVENHIYMSFENLLPGQMFFYDVILHTPTVDYIGEFLTSAARVYGYYEGEEVAYGESILVHELTCSYDPNDKQVFPNGYEEEHYVLNDTELEYLVRFQNTGNAAAINVTVSDTIDENLDLSTFSLMANSHSVMTSINPETRAVDFFFENIMLPDSTSDEPGSHGLVSYKIRPHEDLPASTELNNTANIYFDNNPPIITNTTWTTIYTCELFSASLTEDGITLTASEGVSYQWFLDGSEIDGATEQTYTVLEDGNYSVEVTNYFDCVEVTDEVYIVDVSELEEATIKLFPNPMTETSYLSFEEDCNDCTVRLTSSNGQLVREYNSISGNKLTIERKGLAAGTYVLQVVSGEERVKEFVLVVE